MCYGTEYPEKAPVANSLRQEVIAIIRLGKLISSFRLQATFLLQVSTLNQVLPNRHTHVRTTAVQSLRI